MMGAIFSNITRPVLAAKAAPVAKADPAMALTRATTRRLVPDPNSSGAKLITGVPGESSDAQTARATLLGR